MSDVKKQPHHFHHYQLAQLVAGPPGEPSIGQWFITEVTITSDGYRTRICDGRYPTRERAQAELDYRSGKVATPTMPSNTYPPLQGPDYSHLRGPDWQPEGTPTHWPGPEGKPGPMAYKIGDLTIERVFKPLGITDVADDNMQALWDQIERVLFTALEVH